jgi:hypothetical protein
VKVDWWRAANAIVDLLNVDADSRMEMRRQCREVSAGRYSLACYRKYLDAVVREAVDGGGRPAPPLEPSAFAGRLWAACTREDDGPPPYRRGEASLQAYRELITPFAGAASGTNGHGPRVWCLAAPLVMQDDGALVVHDPIFPIALDVPDRLAHAVGVLLARFAEEPVLDAGTMGGATGGNAVGPRTADDVDGADDAALAEALAWMCESGLVLSSERGTLDPACAPAALGRPHVVMHRLDYRTDVVWIA